MLFCIRAEMHLPVMAKVLATPKDSQHPFVAPQVPASKFAKPSTAVSLAELYRTEQAVRGLVEGASLLSN